MVRHEKSLQKKKMVFPASCHELTTKKYILSPPNESNRRPSNSILHNWYG